MKKVVLIAIMAAIIIAGVSSAYLFSDDKIESNDVPEPTSEPTSGTNYSIELSENLAIEQTP